MTLPNAPIRLAAPVGLLIGLALAALAIASWRIPSGGASPGADVTLAIQPSGELAASPTGGVVTATGLKSSRPGQATQGSVAIRNQTSMRLAVKVRALPSSRALDKSLFVHVRTGGRSLFRGPLGRLRSWSRHSFVLASGASRSVQVGLWIPHAADHPHRGRLVPLPALDPRSAPEYAGQIEDIKLELQTEPVGE